METIKILLVIVSFLTCAIVLLLVERRRLKLEKKYNWDQYTDARQDYLNERAKHLEHNKSHADSYEAQQIKLNIIINDLQKDLDAAKNEAENSKDLYHRQLEQKDRRHESEISRLNENRAHLGDVITMKNGEIELLRVLLKIAQNPDKFPGPIKFSEITKMKGIEEIPRGRLTEILEGLGYSFNFVKL